jgi:hypothetical protein
MVRGINAQICIQKMKRYCFINKPLAYSSKMALPNELQHYMRIFINDSFLSLTNKANEV